MWTIRCDTFYDDDNNNTSQETIVGQETMASEGENSQPSENYDNLEVWTDA